MHADRLLNRPLSGAVHEPTNNSVLFEFDEVRDLEAVFQGKQAGHVYSRSSSGSAVALQNMLNHIEGGVGAVVYSTGMAAISSMIFSLLHSGDHIVVSSYLFGNTRSFFESLSHFDIRVSYVDVTDAQNVKDAMTDATKLVFCEAIANPVTQVSDLANIGALCKAKDILFVVDNTTTPAPIFKAKALDASLVVTSLTKYVAGHGNVLGGVIVDLGNYNWASFDNIAHKYRVDDTQLWGLVQLRKRGLRDMGATLAPQSAHQISVGLETLNMRMQKTCDNAQALAEFCHANPAFERVYYPGLSNHPQQALASELFKGMYGGILSVELTQDIDMRSFINALKLVICATHLGDNRTLALPVATTIFYENGPEQRKVMGISDSLIRISLGIEEIDDVIEDVQNAITLAKQASS